MTADPTPIDQILRQLRRLRRRLVTMEALRAGLWSSSTLLILGWLAVLIEAVAYLPPYWRLIPPGATLIAAAACGVYLFRRGFGAVSDEHSMALHVEGRIGVLRQRLITALELTEASSCSPALLAATRAEALHALLAAPSHQIVPPTRPRRASMAAGLSLLLSILFVSLLHQSVVEVGHRWRHPTLPFAPPQQTHITLELKPGPFIAGDDVDIRLRLHGDIPPTAMLRRRHIGEETWLDEELLTEATSPSSSQATAEDSAQARFVWHDVRQSFEIQALAGDGTTRIQQLTVIDPPVVTGLRLEYDYPAYSGLAPRVEEEGGDIRALAGTRIRLTATSTKTLAAADLVLDDSLSISAEVVDRQAWVNWTVPHRTEDDAGVHRYHLHLVDISGIENLDPIIYAIEILEDEREALENMNPLLELAQHVLKPPRHHLEAEL